MLNVLILTAALGAAPDVQYVPVMAIVAVPDPTFDVAPVPESPYVVYQSRPFGRVFARRPVRRFLGRVVERVRQRPRLRAVRGFVMGR